MTLDASVLRPRPGSRALEEAALVLGAATVVASEFVVMGLAPQLARDLGTPLAATGWLIGAFALGSALLGPLAAIATRRVRADLAMVLALFPFAASALLGLADGLWQVGLLRLIQGAALPVFIGVATEALGRRVGADKAIARIYLGVLAGSVAAGPVGAAMAHLWGWRTALIGLGGLSLAAMALIVLSGRIAVSAPVPQGTDASLNRLGRSAWMQLLVSLAMFAAMFSAYAYLAGLLEKSGVSQGAVSGWLLVFGFAGLVGNFLAGHASAWGLQRSTVAIAMVLLGAAIALPFLGYSPYFLVLLMAVWGAAHAAGFVVCQIRVNRIAPGAPRLTAALNISAANLGIAAGSALGGLGLEAGGVLGVSATAGLLSLLSLSIALAVRAVPALSGPAPQPSPNCVPALD